MTKNSFLKEYYRVNTNTELLRSICEDLFVSIFLRSGTGLFSSIIRGLIAPLFIKANYPILIGRRFRVKHPSNIRLGKKIRIKDDVAFLADGPIKIGNNFLIGEKSILASYRKGLKIGNNVVLGKNCYIAQNGGKIEIGNEVLIADFVGIYSLNHSYKLREIPILHQKAEYCDIKIEENVWIGAGAIIFNNVTIGSGSVIGANTVVNKNVPSNVIFAGNPGRVIKKLNK